MPIIVGVREMRQTTITCDGCGNNLDGGTGYPGFRLILISEPLPMGGGPTCDIYVPPSINEDKYFCRLPCLKKWIEK